jgi:hypothetical protein
VKWAADPVGVNEKGMLLMTDTENDGGALKKACYAAYHESVRNAYNVLSDSITEYFEGHSELYANETLNVPRSFRPLKEYERTLRIQKLTLSLALRTVELRESEGPNSVAMPFQFNGHGSTPHVGASNVSKGSDTIY